MVLALSLVLNQVFPNESRAELGECAWRNSLSSVVHGEDIGFGTTAVQAVSYEKEGSLFVDRTEYWEERENMSLSSTVYQCKGTWLCSIVQEDLLQMEDWKQVSSVYENCWSADQGEKHALLFRTANTLILLSSDQELLPQLGEISLHLE